MKTKKYLIIQIICIFGIVFFTSINLFLYLNGYYKETKVTLKYQENNDIDYKVYLKKNDFFETEYLEKGKTYITSLIDHINVDYNYNIQFDNRISGEYKYYIYAVIESNKSNSNTNYWSKTYNITDEKVMNVKDVKEYSIHENVDIDYNKYNAILNSFKKTLNLNSSSGVLKVFLSVNSQVKGNEVEAPIESKLLLQLPLSEMTIEAAVNLDVQNNKKEVSALVDTNKLKLMKNLGYLYIAAACVSFVLLIYFTKLKNSINVYESTLKKILNTYDGIIVNVKTVPDLSNHQVIDVSSFEELLDAHSEVRMPINFYRGDYHSYFILINDKTAWKYVMKRRK